MREEGKLKVHIESGEAKADFEGDVDKVFELTVKFLTQIYPNLEILRKIVYTPDIVKLVEKVEGLVEITSDGLILLSDLDAPARDRREITSAAHLNGGKPEAHTSGQGEGIGGHL